LPLSVALSYRIEIVLPITLLRLATSRTPTDFAFSSLENPARFRYYNRVFGRVSVPFWTMRFGCILYALSIAAHHIDQFRNHFHVRWSHTCAGSTQMIWLKTKRDWAILPFIRYTVRQRRASSKPETSVSIALFGTIPNPARA
jgi:hypothetical protein